MNIKAITHYTLLHFLVDFSCIYNLTCVIMPAAHGRRQFVIYSLLYNFLAFALPVLLGAVADIIKKDREVVIAGVFLCLLATIIGAGPLPGGLVKTMMMIFTMGTGNGIFHLGSGRQVLIFQGNRYGDCGIFVSSGALGVFLGRLSGIKGWYFITYILIISLVVYLAYLIRFSRIFEEQQISTENPLRLITRTKLGIILLLVVMVIFRGYLGNVRNYSWNNTFLTSLLMVFTVVLGKAVGGVAVDFLGLKRTILALLLCLIAVSWFASNYMMPGLMWILLINMTMPITLTLLVGQLRGLEGFGFGVTMLALFLGTIPSLVEHL